jgi:hypothetical protein
MGRVVMLLASLQKVARHPKHLHEAADKAKTGGNIGHPKLEFTTFSESL